MELLLWRATCTGWKVRRKQSQHFPGADTYLWSTPAFPLSPALLPYLTNWSPITDNQRSTHPGICETLKLSADLSIFLESMQLSPDCQWCPWSCEVQKAFSPMDLAKVGKLHSAELTLMSTLYSTHFCLLSSCPSFTTRVCFSSGCAHLCHSRSISDLQTCF